MTKYHSYIKYNYSIIIIKYSNYNDYIIIILFTISINNLFTQIRMHLFASIVIYFFQIFEL